MKRASLLGFLCSTIGPISLSVYISGRDVLKRREAELRRQNIEAEKKEREMVRVREEERLRAEKAAERREMQRLAKKFAVSLEGTATISIPPLVSFCPQSLSSCFPMHSFVDLSIPNTLICLAISLELYSHLATAFGFSFQTWQDFLIPGVHHLCMAQYPTCFPPKDWGLHSSRTS